MLRSFLILQTYLSKTALPVVSLVVSLALFLCFASFIQHKTPVAQAAGPLPVGQTDTSWNLAFHDEFNGTALDTSKWVTCYYWQDQGCTVGSNDEVEWNLPTNILVNNGILQLRMQKQPITAPTGKTYDYTSGMISTGRDTFDQNVPLKYSFQYGYAEMRAKLPQGKGLWPAFFLLAADDQWPPEIDVMENLGADTTSVQMNEFYGNQTQDEVWYTGPDFSADYHTYAVDWEPNSMVFYIDGVARDTVTDPAKIPHKPMILLANFSAGGWSGLPDTQTVFPSYFSIDYIRVWTKSATPTQVPTPTPTLTPTGVSEPTPTPTPTPTPVKTETAVIYDDKLANTWSNWSWDSTTTFTATPAFKGAHAISWKANKGWAGLYLHTDTPVSTTGYQALSFALKAATSKQKYEIQLFDSNVHALGTPVNISTYGGAPTVGKYKTYTIPLSALKGAGVNISGFQIQNITDTTQPATLIDEITLNHSQSTQPTPTQIIVPSVTPTPVSTTTPTPAARNGLKASYYKTMNLTGSALTQVDPEINFDWGYGSPAPSIPNDSFSIQWDGFVMPNYSETYTFTARADDGVRVWVNNQLVIDDWKDQWATDYSGTISLTAGKKYAIKIQYYDHTEDASMQLAWSSKSQMKAIIPPSNLFTQ